MATRALTPSNVLYSIPDVERLTLRWPIDGPVLPYGDSRRPAVTQLFANQLRPPSPFRHYGIDIGIVTGTPVVAVHSGLVSFVQPWDAGDYGIHVFVRSVWGLFLYAHLSRADVVVGDAVLPGSPIGLSGNTGLSGGPHLHGEARLTDEATRFDWLSYVGRVIVAPRLTDEEWIMALTDERRAALETLADLEIAGKTFAPGEPGRGLLIRMMDVFRDLSDDAARNRALNGAGAAVKRWGRKVGS